MNPVLEWINSLGKAPAIFGLAWFLLVTLVLAAWSLRRRDIERCDRCGNEWKLTAHGNGYHLCAPRRDRVSQ